MDAKRLSRIALRGFKSIRQCDLELKALNVLIGPNGAGKSNFIGFFRLIQQMLEGNLQYYVSKQGGPDALLYFGRHQGEKKSLGSGHFESNLDAHESGLDEQAISALKGWRLYHFHDTSESAMVKQRHGVNDNAYLRPDARNLAAFLYRLQKNFPQHYGRIVRLVQLIAPFFGDFYLRRDTDNPDYIELEWTEKGEDKPFKAHQLSDGTLRFNLPCNGSESTRRLGTGDDSDR